MRPRDYVVSALIIIGVLLVWFLVVAALMNLMVPSLGLSLAVVISFIIYILLKRSKPKP